MKNTLHAICYPYLFSCLLYLSHLGETALKIQGTYISAIN